MQDDPLTSDRPTPSRDVLLARLTEHGQQHVLAHWDTLTESQRRNLADQIDAVDLPRLERLYAKRDATTRFREMVERSEEPPAYSLGSGGRGVKVDDACRRGVEALAAGQVGVILVAGGQGSRLGFDHPKGMYPIGPVSQATLFQIHFEKILARSRRHGVSIPVAVMTSPATHDETVAFIEENDRFGLPAEDVSIFCQGTMPAVDMHTGKLLLSTPRQLALSPDGHGGMLQAIHASGVLDRLGERGVRHLFYLQIDNPLVDIASAELLGYHLLAQSELTTQVVVKQTPTDRVGNVVRIDDRLHVIEYSDLADDLAEQRLPDGSLKIWAGSIAVHVFDVDFLQRSVTEADTLPWHVARKKVAHLSTEVNALKFERFIFDLLPSASNGIVVTVDPSRHFAPLKNKSGDPNGDTPESVRARMTTLHAEWLTSAGVTVAEDVAVEISPLFALDAQEVADKLTPGEVVDQSRYYR